MLASTLQPIGAVPMTDLDRLFDEEASMWRKDLSWSFEFTRKRLESALLEKVLTGFALTDELGACAYATYAVNDEQGLVGSFFATERVRGRGVEADLVTRVLNRMVARNLRAIDCQTLFSSDPGLTAPFIARGFESASRIYMSLDRSAWAEARGATPPIMRSKPIHRTDVPSVTRLVYQAHQERRALDASSSFDTEDSCEKILRQVVLDHVCGPFDSLGSRRIEVGGEAVAACLLTWPLPEVAHLSEVATAPSHRRRGLARQCVAESLASAFERTGARSATLSVTASNRAALALYESFGFKPLVRYESHVLRGPQP
ncbi:MAG: GNAT family N-acetyltransferase [Vicinamibacteria bacterium]|nr:GNAT family N-acetyltransferase [Vicinamibacteria bacterium]